MDRVGPTVALSEPGESRQPYPGRVTIVSSVLLFREGLAASLGRDGRLDVIDAVTSLDAVAAISRNKPDALLLDGAAAESLDLARKIRNLAPDVRIVGFGIAAEAEHIVDFAQSGVAAVVDCNGSVRELVEAVFSALRGEVECSPRVSALLCANGWRVCLSARQRPHRSPAGSGRLQC